MRVVANLTHESMMLFSFFGNTTKIKNGDHSLSIHLRILTSEADEHLHQIMMSVACLFNWKSSHKCYFTFIT